MPGACRWEAEMSISCDSDNTGESLDYDDVAFVNSFRFRWYCFRFIKMSKIDAVSLIIKIQKMCDTGCFNPYELTDYLLTRQIGFRLRYLPAGFNLVENITHLVVVLKINLKILKREFLKEA